MRRLIYLWSLIVSALFVVGCNETPPDVEKPAEKPEITIQLVEFTASSLTFEISTTVAGEAGYVVVAEGYSTPSINEWFGVNSVQVEDKTTVKVDNLVDDTNYTLYVALRSADGGILSSPKNHAFTTPNDGVTNPIELINATYDSFTFSINIEGDYMFVPVTKTELARYNQPVEAYLEMFPLRGSGAQTYEWYDGGNYGGRDISIVSDSDYIIAASRYDSEGKIAGKVYTLEFRTPAKPQSSAGVETKLSNITSTSVDIETTPDSSVVTYYIYVRDKAWYDSIRQGYGESMVGELILRTGDKWTLTSANKATWSGLLPATAYYAGILVQDHAGGTSLSYVEFTTEASSGVAPEVDASFSLDPENGHNTLHLNIFSAQATSVKICHNTTADIAMYRNLGMSDSEIVAEYGYDISGADLEALRTSGISFKIEDLWHEVEYTAIVSVKNAEQTETVESVVMTTTSLPSVQRVESPLFESLVGEWSLYYEFIDFRTSEERIEGATVRIAAGVDDKSAAEYRSQNRLVILDWAFQADWKENPIPTFTPADLMAADDYWKNNPQLAYRDYGPKLFLEIAADGTVTMPSARNTYFYNWDANGYTIMFYGCDYENLFTAPASFPVTISEDGNTIVIGACNSGEEFGYGIYRPSMFRKDGVLWNVAISDIVLTRVE